MRRCALSWRASGGGAKAWRCAGGRRAGARKCIELRWGCTLHILEMPHTRLLLRWLRTSHVPNPSACASLPPRLSSRLPAAGAVPRCARLRLGGQPQGAHLERQAAGAGRAHRYEGGERRRLPVDEQPEPLPYEAWLAQRLFAAGCCAGPSAVRFAGLHRRPVPCVRALAGVHELDEELLPVPRDDPALKGVLQALAEFVEADPRSGRRPHHIAILKFPSATRWLLAGRGQRVCVCVLGGGGGGGGVRQRRMLEEVGMDTSSR